MWDLLVEQACFRQQKTETCHNPIAWPENGVPPIVGDREMSGFRIMSNRLIAYKLSNDSDRGVQVQLVVQSVLAAAMTSEPSKRASLDRREARPRVTNSRLRKSSKTHRQFHRGRRRTQTRPEGGLRHPARPEASAPLNHRPEGQPGGPAANAGVLRGDILVSIAGAQSPLRFWGGA
jgi:hypothetical protein